MRRDVSKLIGLGLDEGLPGDWEALRMRGMALMTPLRRVRDDRDLAVLEADLAVLQAEISKMLELQIDVKKSSGNDRQSGEHQSNSNPQCFSDLEPPSVKGGVSWGLLPMNVQLRWRMHRLISVPIRRNPPKPGPPPIPVRSARARSLPRCEGLRLKRPHRQLGRVLRGCRALRPMLGISQDAWRDAQSVLGKAGACRGGDDPAALGAFLRGWRWARRGWSVDEHHGQWLAGDRLRGRLSARLDRKGEGRGVRLGPGADGADRAKAQGETAGCVMRRAVSAPSNAVPDGKAIAFHERNMLIASQKPAERFVEGCGEVGIVADEGRGTIGRRRSSHSGQGWSAKVADDQPVVGPRSRNPRRAMTTLA